MISIGFAAKVERVSTLSGSDGI